MDALGFWFGSAVTLGSALMVVTRKNAVSSVMWLVLAFLGMAVLFFDLNAGFIGVIQILVYAGAIMVLFLFVIMLLNLTPTGLARTDRPRFTLLGLVASGAFIGAVIKIAWESASWRRAAEIVGYESAIGQDGDVLAVGNHLFTYYLVPFEVTSVLLLVAIVGAVVLTKKDLA